MYNTLISPRLRRVFTSSFFGATFAGAFITVAATTALASGATNGEGPLACPAQQRKKREAEARQRDYSAAANGELDSLHEEDDGAARIAGRYNVSAPSSTSSTYSNRIGERVRLTSKGGWIEIPETLPSR